MTLSGGDLHLHVHLSHDVVGVLRSGFILPHSHIAINQYPFFEHFLRDAGDWEETEAIDELTQQALDGRLVVTGRLELGDQGEGVLDVAEADLLVVEVDRAAAEVLKFAKRHTSLDVDVDVV